MNWPRILKLAFPGGGRWRLAAAAFPGFSLDARFHLSPQSLWWIFGDQNVDVRDHEHWAQLDGAYTFGEGVLSDIKFGGRYSKHSRHSDDVIGQGPGCGGSALLKFASESPQNRAFGMPGTVATASSAAV